MKRYLDTSIVVSLFVQEVHTAATRNWLADEPGAKNLISAWTVTEFQSALSLKLRTSQISYEIKVEASAFLETARQTLFEVLPILDEDFERAAALAANPDLWLRAGDALNLAIAEREQALLATVDKRLFAAAERIGLRAHLPQPT